MFDHLFPDKLYFSILGYLLLIIVYAPIVLFLLALVWDILKTNKFIKTVIIIGLLVLAIIVPFYDVYISSLEMSQSCKEKAGLYIYEKVNTDSFYSEKLLWERSLYDGFQFVEGVKKNKKLRVELDDNNFEKYTPISKFQSKYGFVVSDEIINKYLMRANHMIVDSENQKVLAEYINFYYYPGWFERAFVYKYLGYTAQRCDIESLNVQKFVASVLMSKPYQLED